MSEKYVVNLTEYSTGFKPRNAGYEQFSTLADANNFMVEYNKLHNSNKILPEWYIIAEVPVVVVEENSNN